MVTDLRTAVAENDLREFKTLAGRCGGPIPWDVENKILVERKMEFLRVLIDLDILSDFARGSMTGLMDGENELLLKLKE